MYKWRTRRMEHDLTLSVYNATDRRNPYFIYLQPETVPVEGTGIEVPVSISAKQVSLFPVLPSITWNFKF